VLDPTRPARVVHEICGFVQRLAAPGALNGLSQLVLRLTSPGIPDFYQGTEFWDFSMVDPDNRRPVDYAARSAALEADATPDELLECWQDGRIKQAILHRILALRARNPALFAAGAYTPLRLEGPAAEHAIAYLRELGDHSVMAIVSRLSATQRLKAVPRLPVEFWQGTYLCVPRSLQVRRLVDGLRGPAGGEDRLAMMADETGRIWLDEALATLPVALLEAK
jgi:(1->4)-alpha-D-glucan 1-alpha-D-glucosylmutase